jgi:ribosomal protein L11 methyltransferase
LDWLEFSVTTSSEASGAVVDLLNRYGWGQAAIEVPVDCFEIELATATMPAKVIVKTWLPLDGTAEGSLRRLEEGLGYLQEVHADVQSSTRELAEANWLEAWKQQYHLLRVGRRIVIVPAWEEYAPAPGEVIICLEPGMAFGTGLHSTTRLCLEAMEGHLIPACTVLDVGTGSGVLSIAAAKLGARSVCALDADPMAVKVARENAERNCVADRVHVRHASLPGGTPAGLLAHFGVDHDLDMLHSGSYDLVLVNILAPVIVGMAEALAERMAPGGQLIAAGLVQSQEGDVEAALRAQGLQIFERSREEDWVSLVARRG